MMDSPKSKDPTSGLPSNKKSPPQEGGYYANIDDMWTLKHEIRSPKFCELLITTELKGETALDLKKLYNHINMCLNVVNII